MRTTVEMKPKHRAALISIASRRGEKGFSGVLGEVIDFYLRSQDGGEERKKRLLALGGSISAKDAEHLRRVSRDLREHWR